MADNTMKKEKGFIAMNSVRANGNSVAMDTNIAVTGKAPTEDQYYAAHGDKMKEGLFSRLKKLFRK